MKIGNGWASWMIASTILLIVTPVLGESPWTPFIPFKRVDAGASGTNDLRDEHGPWLILAASFAGEGAERQARELVLELRQRYKITHTFTARSTTSPSLSKA